MEYFKNNKKDVLVCLCAAAVGMLVWIFSTRLAQPAMFALVLGLILRHASAMSTQLKVLADAQEKRLEHFSQERNLKFSEQLKEFSGLVSKQLEDGYRSWEAQAGQAFQIKGRAIERNLSIRLSDLVTLAVERNALLCITKEFSDPAPEVIEQAVKAARAEREKARDNTQLFRDLDKKVQRLKAMALIVSTKG